MTAFHIAERIVLASLKCVRIVLAHPFTRTSRLRCRPAIAHCGFNYFLRQRILRQRWKTRLARRPPVGIRKVLISFPHPPLHSTANR